MNVRGSDGPNAADRVPSGLIQHLPAAMIGLAVIAGFLLALPALAPPAELVPAAAPAPSATPSLPPSDPSALRLLASAAQAGAACSWTGTEVISTLGDGATTVIADVDHRAGVGTELRVVGGSEQIGTTAFNPDGSGFAGESPMTDPGADLSNTGRWESVVTRDYAVSDGGPDEVAGLSARRLDLRRADGSTAGRIWVDVANGLPLQRQVLGVDGQLLRYLTFTKVAVVANAQVSLGSQRVALSSADLGKPVASLSQLEAEGWRVPSSVGSGMQLVDARAFGPAAAHTTIKPTVQLIYTDGLSTLALSETHGQLAASLPAGWREIQLAGADVHEQSGMPRRLAWGADGLVFTVVTDADPAVLPAALALLPRPAAKQAYTSRIRHGLDRVGSWMDPRR